MRQKFASLLLDSKAAARAAELRYTSDTEPGIERRRRGKGFSYYRGGRRVEDGATLARIRTLAIPPAWRDVWICPSPNGHIQATGKDAKGRKQYRYHPRWRSVRDAAKYEHVVLFAEALPRLRARVEKDLSARGLPRRKVVAAIIELMQRTCLRVGNDCYAEANKSYGLTTLQDHHAEIRGAEVRFRFRGKGGKPYQVQISDPRLARVVRRCRDIPGQRLFQYEASDGSYRAVTSGDVNDYLKEATGQPFSAKNFRTWGATLGVALVLGACEAARSMSHGKSTVTRAIEQVAAQLGNTVAICRKCYVHPVVVEAYTGGTLHDALKRARASWNGRPPRGLRAEEALVLAFLQEALQGRPLRMAA
jgi:DNA topoisomerase I